MMEIADVIRLAREAGFSQYQLGGMFDVYLEQFAAAAYAAGQAAEREECARVCDAHTVDDVLVGVSIAQSCAAIIRARGEKGGK